MGELLFLFKIQMLKRVRIFLKIKFIMMIIIFSVPSVPSCQLGYSSICKSSVSNDEKTAICPATNLVNIFLKGKALV